MTTKKSTTSRRASTTRKTTTSASKAQQKDVLDTAEDVLHTDVPSEPAAETDAVEVEELPLVPHPDLKKKELVDLVVERSGVKKRDAKPAVEAALAVLGEALSEGRELNLVPFGKLKVTRMKRAGNGQIINARVRQPEADEISATDPLAQAAE